MAPVVISGTCGWLFEILILHIGGLDTFSTLKLMISFPLALCCVAIICNFLEINYSGVKEALREATVTTGRSVGFKALFSL